MKKENKAAIKFFILFIIVLVFGIILAHQNNRIKELEKEHKAKITKRLKKEIKKEIKPYFHLKDELTYYDYTVTIYHTDKEEYTQVVRSWSVELSEFTCAKKAELNKIAHEFLTLLNATEVNNCD